MESHFLAQNRTVRRVLSVVDSVASEHGYPAVTDLVLGRKSPSVQQDGAEQLATYASSVAMLALLRERGTYPSAIVAQSMGEIAAWVAAGAHSVESGAHAVCFLNDAHAAHPCEGGLVIAATDEEGAKNLIRRVGSPDLVIAGLNTARQTLLSGGEEAVGSLLALVDQPGVPRLRRLSVPYATHHPRLEPIARQFESALRTLPMGPPQVPVYSIVGRRWYADADADADAFYRSLADCVIKPMYLREALEQFSANRPERFIELGAGDNMTRATRIVLRGSSTIAPLARDIFWLSSFMGSSAVSGSQS